MATYYTDAAFNTTYLELVKLLVMSSLHLWPLDSAMADYMTIAEPMIRTNETRVSEARGINQTNLATR